MSMNGMKNPSPRNSISPIRSPPPPPPIDGPVRASLDSEHSGSGSALGLSSPLLAATINGNSDTKPNGMRHDSEAGQSDVEPDTIEKLQLELARTNEEREQLATQYRNLLGKLTTMRNTLGNKLKQDAEELDRREQEVQQLTAQNDDLVSTVETLKSELISTAEEAERASRELDNMRSKALHDNTYESMLKDRELRETQSELERCRMERDEWEQMAMTEKIGADEGRTLGDTLRRELEQEQDARERATSELEFERERSSNLQSVLEDFQAAKDHELSQATSEYKKQLDQVTLSLAEFKQRALNAELQLEETTSDASRTQGLEKEVKEKGLLIGKLRHESVIMNEHLMEALRRLRRNSSDTNVDRRLVTNVLLSFLVTPRADPKRFEMLQLISSVLHWTDNEKEKAGLQKSAAPVSTGLGGGVTSGFWGRSSNAGSPKRSQTELEKTDETESFSRLWVEFLLTEANAGVEPASPVRSSPANGSVPPSPTQGLYGPSTSPTGPGKVPLRRLSSFGASATSNLPNLTLEALPSRKGKEKAVDS